MGNSKTLTSSCINVKNHGETMDMTGSLEKKFMVGQQVDE